MSAAGATLLTFTRKRVLSSPSADEAAKRPRVGEPGGRHLEGSPWARVRSHKPPVSRQPGVGRPLFTAPAAAPGKERPALGQSRSHNSSGAGTECAGQRRSGAARRPASALQAKVEFFHAVDQEELVVEEEVSEEPRSALATARVPFPTPGPGSLRPPSAPPSVRRLSPQPSGLLASLGRGGGSGAPLPMRPPPRHVTSPEYHHHHHGHDGEDISCSVFEGATRSVRARWEAIVAASPGDMPPPQHDAMQLDGADATSPAPGAATRVRRDTGSGGAVRGLAPRVPADPLLAAAAGDDDAPDSFLGAPAETWCNPPPSARVEATGSVAAAATATQGPPAQFAVVPQRIAAPPPPPSSPCDGRAGTGSGSGGGVYTLLMNAAAQDAAAHASRAQLPAGFAVIELSSFEEAPELHNLSASFAAEDARIGRLPLRGPCGNAHGCVSLVKHLASGTAVGYALHYPHQQPPWRGNAHGNAADVSSLPPRLAHLYIHPHHRRGGLGTGLLAWWRQRHAARVALFAVDTPNDAMNRCLSRLGCAPATQASGYDAQAVHYVGVPPPAAQR